MHEEPWSFAVIQDRNLLNRLSESAKERVRNAARGSDSDHAKHALELVNKPDFHVFYNGGTLIVSNITSDSTALANGDTFTLFSASASSGNFAIDRDSVAPPSTSTSMSRMTSLSFAARILI